jgi:hypothetical protein
MDEADYWRDQAIRYREEARRAGDRRVQDELMDLGAACETVAESIEEHRFGG